MSHSANDLAPNKQFAAQNAKEGLINVSDLSLLTGIVVSQLTKFAKAGHLENFGEYHGKRFFNFQSIVNWAHQDEDGNEARIAIRKAMEKELLADDCPYSIEKISHSEGESSQINLNWKVLSAA